MGTVTSVAALEINKNYVANDRRHNKEIPSTPPNINKVNIEVHDSRNKGERRHPPTMGLWREGKPAFSKQTSLPYENNFREKLPIFEEGVCIL